MIRQAIICAIVLCLTYSLVSGGSSSKSKSSKKSKSSDASSSKAVKLSKHSLLADGSSSESKSSEESKLASSEESKLASSEENILPISEENILPSEENILPSEENILPSEENILPSEENILPSSEENILSNCSSNEKTTGQTCNEQGVCAYQFSTKVSDCGSNPADVMFLVDASYSVGTEYFQKQLDFIANFAKSFVIGPDNMQIGVIMFDHDVYNQFNLSTYLSIDTLVNNIEKIPYSAGQTKINKAMAYVMNHSFTQAAGDRPQVANILISLTDGISPMYETITEAEKLHQTDIESYIVAIGRYVWKTQINLIATDAEHVFYLQEFDILDTLPAKLKKSLCLNEDCIDVSDLVSGTNRIADANITASSFIDEYKPFYGRYDHVSAWRPINQSSDEYLQFAFASVKYVVGFKFQSNHTTKYNITTSTDCTEFNTTLPVISTGQEIEATSMLQEPILAKCVRFYALEWQSFIQMNIAILGCI